MRKHLIAALWLLLSLGLFAPALAQSTSPVILSGGCGTGSYPTNNGYLTIDTEGHLCASLSPGNQITGNASGTTGAVVGTLAAVAGKTTFICGFSVDAIGGTAAVGPITVAGLVGSSMVFQLTSSATGTFRSQPIYPCVPASAVNTAITITTTADGTASAVNVNAWGYQQ